MLFYFLLIGLLFNNDVFSSDFESSDSDTEISNFKNEYVKIFSADKLDEDKNNLDKEFLKNISESKMSLKIDLSNKNPSDNIEFFNNVFKSAGIKMKSFICNNSNINDNDLIFLNEKLPKSVEFISLVNNENISKDALKEAFSRRKNLEIKFGIVEKYKKVSTSNAKVYYFGSNDSKTIIIE